MWSPPTSSAEVRKRRHFQPSLTCLALILGKLALFLLEPHPKMPNMNLSRNEANDLAAYIALQGK